MGVFGIGWMTLQISYSMLKKSEVMRIAVERIVRDDRVVRELGPPVGLGGTARLEFTLRGSKQRAVVTLRAEKVGGGVWKYLLLEVKGAGGETISCADGVAEGLGKN